MENQLFQRVLLTTMYHVKYQSVIRLLHIGVLSAPMHAIRDDPENHPSLRSAGQACAQESFRAAANLTIMSIALTTFNELTDHGVLGRPHLAELLNSQDLKALEERFLTKGTVIVTRDDVILQAVQIRGSQRAREVWFAPSSLSRTVAAAAKVKASEVYSTGGVSHVFMNVLGATFTAREGGAEDATRPIRCTLRSSSSRRQLLRRSWSLYTWWRC